MKITEQNKSEIKIRQKYEAPAIEIVEVIPEKGFAQSFEGPTGNGPGNDSH